MAHIKPTTEAEREIALAMEHAQRMVAELREQHPEIPPNALSVGLINYGIQLGVAHAGTTTVATYLGSAENRVDPGSNRALLDQPRQG
jgi:hypothetical protein